MSGQRRIWSLVLPIAVLALLLGTTAGMIWHHHMGAAPDNCPICHLSHQAIEPTVANIRTATLVPVGSGPEPQAVRLIPSSVPRDLPPRGPPV